MSLTSKLLNRFGYVKVQPKPLLNEVAAAELREAITPPPKSKGRMVKETKSAEYTLSTKRKGGRVVKAMPRQLQRMKSAQEKVENDNDVS